MEPCLHIENLTKHYANFSLQDVSFSVPAGSIVGLIGQNGAGKSTTIRAALGLLQPDGGHVSFFGKELTDLDKNDIGVVFDGDNFHDILTPRQIGNIAAAAYTRHDSNMYASFLRKFDLPENSPIKTMSKGMKTKLHLAVALSHHPRLLILDEATNGLDPVVREEILDLFLDFVQDESHAVLISSHITTDLEKIADYITLIHDGRVLFSKEKDELRYKWGILRCTASDFASIEKGDILAYRQEDCSVSILVANRDAAARSYPFAVADTATVDDILLLCIKGERNL